MTETRLADRRLRIAFFGTPEFAQSILQSLLDAGDDDVVLVVSQPDKPQGRKRKIVPPPVKALALSREIEVAQPRKMKDGSLARLLVDRRIDLGIVAAYGRILTQDTLDAPVFGFWNVHGSLLPRHRGAAPMQQAVLEGDERTGVDLMVMTAGCDEGPVLDRREFPLDDAATIGTLSVALARLGGALLVEGLRTAKREGLDAVDQDHDAATYTRLLTKQDGLLDFALDAKVIDRRIRALNPWPGTFVRPDSGPLRILEARAVATQVAVPPGTVVEAQSRLIVAAGTGALEILRLQPPGKRPMPACDYLRGAGREVREGDLFPGC